MNKNISIQGFTLAEVLLTLAIIGIVAALTVPALMNSTNDTENKTAYKKAFNDAYSAYFQIISNQQLTYRTTKYEESTSQNNFNVFKSYFAIRKECLSNTNTNGECWDQTGEKVVNTRPSIAAGAFIDNSGRAWSLYSNDENIILVDVNGFKKPNSYGRDRWIFTEGNEQNQRINSGLPQKLMIFWDDILDHTSNPPHNAYWCPTPPCYYKSWLFN